MLSWLIVQELSHRVVFLLGLPDNQAEQEQLTAEARERGDIVQGSFIDSYRNLTYKNVMGLLWTTTFCPQVGLVAKTDDDMWLDPWGLVALAPSLPPSTLACPLINTTVQRQGKWGVDWKEVGLDSYPTACSGWLYLLSPNSAALLLQAAQQQKTFLWIDDVWVTGILASKVGLGHLSLSRLVTSSPSRLALVKRLQGPLAWHWDLVAGPWPGLGTARDLARRARRCGQEPRCRSNLHTPGYTPGRGEVRGEEALLGLLRVEERLRQLYKIYA